MKKIICLLIASIFFAAVVIPLPAGAENLPFSDVAQTDWFYEYVSFVSERGFMIGLSNTRFGPKEKMTRGQFITILSRLSNDDISAYSASSGFTDVDPAAYYAAPVAWAKANGIANGTGSGRFGPNSPVLRQEFAAFFVRYMKYMGISLPEDFSTSPFTEIFPEWAKNDIETLHRTGLVLGDNAGLFNPGNGMTRAEIAAVVTRFVKTVETEPAPPFDPGPYDLDPTPEKIGIAYENEETGLKFSYVRLIEENGSAICAAGGVGAHGGHETRLVRTPYGTYATYITEATGKASDDHPLWHQGVATFSVIKITSDGFHVLFEDEYPQANGSCTPNVLYGENGKVYATVICDNKDRYMGSMGTSDFRNGIWLAVYEIDVLTDEVTKPSAPTLIDHETSPFDDHGYGYTQPILDNNNGKLYAIACGGEGEEGYLAWFIYDLKTRTWDPECYTVTVDTRRCYINGYPDGKNGFTFVIERCAQKGRLAANLGLEFTGDPDSYVWDALYLYHIADPRKEEYVEVPICVPDYVAEGAVQNGKYYFDGASHYGTGGCTYLDLSGRLHVIYTHTVSSTRKTTVYHAIYDLSGNKLYCEPIPTELIQKNGMGSISSNGFVMTQGTDGTYYVFFMKGAKTASFEVWSSPSGDGINFTRIEEAVELKTPDGKPVAKGTKPIIANSRNHSVLDGVAAIMFHSTEQNDGGDPYYYFSVDLP
ncbi:MAG: S-layer homology domain-containing protein [Clostridia bacterium]|nr:S-layer homology domain-containing protein [Clostridia bacterium]